MGTRPDQPTMSTAALWAAWWVALLAVWFLLVDTTAPQELVTGAVSAAVAATLAVSVHRRGYIRFQPRAAWLRQTPELAWNVVTDCGLLGVALWRKVVRREAVEGFTVRVPFHHGGDKKPSLVKASWTGYKKAGPLLVSTEHRGTADGKPLHISITNVSVKLTGSDKWMDAQ